MMTNHNDTKQHRVLLVARDSAVLPGFIRQLSRCERPVHHAGTPQEARTVLADRQAGQPPTELVIVLLDAMPDGLELVKEITFLYRGMPVLAVSSRSSVHEARDAIAQGAVDYMMLPVEDAVLAATLQRYSDRYFDPELGRGRRLIFADPEMNRILTQVRRVARSKATVLINGESGTGKELVARYLHQVSDRAGGPFVAINCAALPENLLESELFGHARGAFTGAVTDRKGKFLQANGGTILLDEISEMSLNLQAKLLRVLQEGEVDPVGGRGSVALDVRVVASTNRNLKSWAMEGRFREDLFYRLNVFPIRLPPLRDRPGDVVLLAEHFRVRFIEEFGRNEIRFSRDALSALQRYTWAGNVRELENVIQRSLLVAEGNEISVHDLMLDPAAMPAAAPASHESAADGMSFESADTGDGIRFPVGTTVRQMEELLIRRTLSEVDGNRTKAAEILGISIRTLRNKLNEYANRGPE
jgi:two-component system response regulator FlrC